MTGRAHDGDVAPSASLRGVAHCYDASVPVLVDVDLDLWSGEILALVGANGSGKTTLLSILAGLRAPAAGEVELAGIAAPANAGGRRGRELRRRVGYVPQDPALDPEMTGGEILELLAALYGVAPRQRRQRVRELAERFGVASHLGRRSAAYSGGLRRRLHLAAGMMHDPEVLLVDEPTAGLDVDGSRFLWSELARRAGDGRAVVIVTHDLDAVERHAHRVAVLDGGHLVRSASPQELAAAFPPDLAAAYRGLTGRDPSALAPLAGRGRAAGGTQG